MEYDLYYLNKVHWTSTYNSSRKYETIARIKLVLYALTKFLSTKHVNHHLENILKSQLLEKTKLYFEDKISEEQSRLTGNGQLLARTLAREAW
jgi:hypothetical protein